MKKENLEHNIVSAKNYRQLFWAIVIFSLIVIGCGFYAVFRNYSLSALLIAIGILVVYALFSLFLYTVFFIYQFEVLSDRVIHRNMFGRKKEYKFIDYPILNRQKYIAILNTKGKAFIKISMILDNYNYLVDTYEEWRNTNNAPKTIINIVKYDSRVRNFIIFLFILGIITLVCTIIVPITTDINAEDDMIVCFFLFLILCISSLLLGIYLLCLYKNWKIEIRNNTLIYRNVFRSVKEYPLSELTWSSDSNSTYLYYNDKMIIKFRIHVVENDEILCSIIKKQVDN